MEILIVEDDPIFSKLLEEALSLWGHRAKSVCTGGLALEKMKKNPFDVILLDIFLPDGQGNRLIGYFKNISPKVHIITMTGHNSRELEKEVRREGISYYMIKPFNIDHLKDLIDHMNLKNMLEREA